MLAATSLQLAWLQPQYRPWCECEHKKDATFCLIIFRSGGMRRLGGQDGCKYIFLHFVSYLKTTGSPFDGSAVRVSWCLEPRMAPSGTCACVHHLFALTEVGWHSSYKKEDRDRRGAGQAQLTLMPTVRVEVMLGPSKTEPGTSLLTCPVSLEGGLETPA